LIRGVSEPLAYQLELHDVAKAFGSVRAVDNVNLHISHGEFLTLLGPSGSGKTTTLNMIAGFEIPSAGRILLESRDITTVPPNRRGIGMVFQNYALFPHMTVFENIAFPLRMRKTPAAQIRKMAEEALELVKLPGFGHRYPRQLSGGQQQRIALARAIVFKPKILLMDEPLGALDKKLRDHMRIEIKNLQMSLKITVIYVTHDQEEALTMSDRIAIMNEGGIVQLDTTEALYENPASLFVADFIGESNFIRGRVGPTKGRKTPIEVERRLTVWVDRLENFSDGDQVVVAVRPEKIQIFEGDSKMTSATENRFRGRITSATYVGEAKIYEVSLSPNLSLRVKVQSGPGKVDYDVGADVTIGWQTRHGLALI